MVIPMSTFYLFFIILGAALAIYLILLLRQAFLILRYLNKLLTENKENISLTIHELPTISKNVSEITDNAKDITNVATEITAEALEVKNSIAANFSNTFDLIKTIKNFLTNFGKR